MADILSTLSIVSFVIAGVCLVLAVFFWFFFKIPTVINDLTGRTARKSIAQMRAANEKAGTSSCGGSKINMVRGRLTETMAGEARPGKRRAEMEQERPETGLLAENEADALQEEATGLLDEEVTGSLLEEEETVLLNEERPNRGARTGGEKLTMLDEVMLINTDEEIS